MKNYKLGAIKRKLGIKGDFQPGDLISKANEKRSIIKTNQPLSKKQVAIRGLI